MSAPDEVWVLWPIGEEDGDGLAVHKQTALKSGIRYLRADLTCGECANRPPVTEWCIKRDAQSWEYSPACMAFQEKK